MAGGRGEFVFSVQIGQFELCNQQREYGTDYTTLEGEKREKKKKKMSDRTAGLMRDKHSDCARRSTEKHDELRSPQLTAFIFRVFLFFVFVFCLFVFYWCYFTAGAQSLHYARDTRCVLIANLSIA